MCSPALEQTSPNFKEFVLNRGVDFLINKPPSIDAIQHLVREYILNLNEYAVEEDPDESEDSEDPY